MKEQIHKLIIYSIFLFLASGCEHKKDNMQIRNEEVSFLFINKSDFENKFKPFVKDLNKERFISMLFEMEQTLKDSGSTSFSQAKGKDDLDYLYDFDDSVLTLKKQIFTEISEKYKSSDISNSKKEIEIDVLQPILFFNASDVGKTVFYSDLQYHPSMELSMLFDSIDEEVNKPDSANIEYINPYSPLCEGLEDVDQIYHAVIKKKLVESVLEKLKNKIKSVNDPRIEGELKVLIEIFTDALNDKVLVIRQLTP